MPTEKTQGKAILAGLAIAGALVLALSLPEPGGRSDVFG